MSSHLLTSPAILIWLLDQGANPNTMAGHAPGGNHPFSPLCEAAEHMYPFALLILLGKGAALDPEAIFYAIGSANNGTATLQTLIEYGADVNYVHKIWGTPLLHCIRTKQMEKLRVLFETGADLVMKDARGRRILEFADVEFANIHKMIVEGELDEYLGFRDLLKEHLDGKEKGLY